MVATGNNTIPGMQQMYEHTQVYQVNAMVELWSEIWGF